MLFDEEQIAVADVGDANDQDSHAAFGSVDDAGGKCGPANLSAPDFEIGMRSMPYRTRLGDAGERMVLFGSSGEPILMDGHNFAVIEADQVVVDSERFLGSVDLRDGTAAAMREWNAETGDDRSPLPR